MAGNQVQEGMAGASPVSLLPVCRATSSPGLGFPGLTTKAGLIKAETPTPPLGPSSAREPWAHTVWTTYKVRWLGGLNQDEPCSIGKGPVIQSECGPCQAHKAAEGGAHWKCVYWCGQLVEGGEG